MITELDLLPRTDPGFKADLDDFFGVRLPNFVEELNEQASLVTAASAGGIPYLFNTSTTVEDPTAGKLRLNHATQNLATVLVIDTTDSASVDRSAQLATYDDSTSNTFKGTGRIQNADGTKFIDFIGTAFTFPGGYVTVDITVTAYSAASPFAASDPVSLVWNRAGDLGQTGPASGQTMVERSSNTVLTDADKSTVIKATAGYTQTLNAIATYDDDFIVYLEQEPGVDGTLDPSSGELVDGRATIPLYGSEKRLLRKNDAGDEWETVVLRGFFKRWTGSNATAPVPTGYPKQWRRAIGGGASGGSGGGGGGGNTTNTNCGGGGGGGSAGSNGASETREVDASLLGTTEAVVVGAGGSAPSGGVGGNGGFDGANGTAGNNGGASSSGAGTVTEVSAAGGTAGGRGRLGNRGQSGSNGAISTASDAAGTAVGATALTARGAVDTVGAAGANGTQGAAGVGNTSGGAGGDGGANAASLFSAAAATVTGGSTQTTAAPAAGNDGTDGTAGASPGQGGTGGSGGSGSRGVSGSVGKGGDGGDGGAGADGCVDWWGYV